MKTNTYRTLLHSKIHRALVTSADVDYEGSLKVDTDLLDAAGMREFELKDAIEDLQGYLRGLVYLIGGPAMKHLRAFIDRLSAWIKANRELIAQRVERFIEVLARGFRIMWQLAEPVVDILGSILGLLLDYPAALVAVAIGLAAVFNPPLLIVGALLLALEEIWGWITGKRETLLEKTFGPFDELVKTNPVAQMIEGWIMLLKNVRDVAAEIRAMFPGGGMGPSERRMRADSTAMSKAFEVVGATGMHSQWELAKDPRFAELARAGGWGTLAREYGGGKPSIAAPAAGATNASFNLTLKVDAPTSVDPGVWGEQVSRAVTGQLDAWWDSKMSHAYPAAGQ